MTTNPATVTRLPQRNLDVLRACAVLGVLANHLDVAVNDPSMTRQWIANWLGRAGVLAFFVHTSLVLMSSLERQSGGAVAFYIRRALRIYPLAMFAVLAVRLFHITPWIPQIGRQAHFTLASWKAVGANMLLVQNLVGVRDITSVLWTLPIEVQMYLVLPACYVLATRGVGTVLVALAVGVAGGYLWDARIIPGLFRLNTMAFVPCFLSGVLCFALLRGGGDAKLPSWCWLVAIPSIAAIAWFLGVRGADNSFVFEAHPWLQWGPCVALAVAIPLIRELPDVALTRSAKVVAKYSYGIYLLHIPALAIGLVALRGAPVWIQWTACAGMLVLLPLLAYRAIEGPGIDLGKYLADRWSHGRDRVAPEVDAADVPAP